MSQYTFLMNVRGDFQQHTNVVETITSRMAYTFADHLMLSFANAAGFGAMMKAAMEQPHEHADNKPAALPVQLIAKTACDMAEVLYAEMTRRELFAITPSLAEINDERSKAGVDPLTLIKHVWGERS